MPKDTPKMAGTIMKTSSRVNHTVKEMPRRIHTKLSKGLKKSSILQSGWWWSLPNSWNQRGEQMAEEVRHSTSWPQVALVFCQKKAFIKMTRGWSFSSHSTENQYKYKWPSWFCPHGQYWWTSLFLPSHHFLIFQFPAKGVCYGVKASCSEIMSGPCWRCATLSEQSLPPERERDVNNERKTTGHSRRWRSRALLLSVTQTCKDVQTNSQHEACPNNTSSLTGVPIVQVNHARQKTRCVHAFYIPACKVNASLYLPIYLVQNDFTDFSKGLVNDDISLFSEGADNFTCKRFCYQPRNRDNVGGPLLPLWWCSRGSSITYQTTLV